ncbi:RNA-directed DNA polymerase (Reverse transcriptase), Ribonuclease H-like protein [Cucumis melo var. makuwa]|uniref:RNA-directed DNA polymerase (Reverse transcriptase), Ribonuclease H-like protein n=1 Tax=Cucumis melo var. makuwa TaxID=1194695 RepID=A0A5D3DLA4_CUCMM|nr:RNA-directed DNA polymerase (Reverse transcriptase), Ribonuclease H-like protein [Cucumis melo var. makuwa]TYK24416.1 RNA-directed DNA polymerase (Reverse transcriptase), Ribonuclease H-like protein [Cucumis melo var. makuwa]
MEEQDKNMDKMRQEINNLGEQVSKILELLSMGKGKVVVDTTQSSNPIQDTDDSVYPLGFTSCHMNVPQSQTTQHYVATNPLYAVSPPVPCIEHLEAQAKIQHMGKNENTSTKQKLDVLEDRMRAIERTDVYGNIDATQLCLVPGLIIPAKFKIPKFDKYDGSSCPMSHLIIPFRLAMNGEEEFGKLQRICSTMERYGYRGSATVNGQRNDIYHGRLAEATTEYGGIKKGTISKKEGEGQGSKTNSDTWKFDPIPMTYTELLPQLIQNRQLTPIPMIPIQPPYPKWYDSNAQCDYHAGGVGDTQLKIVWL